jgi:uncharacterized protein (DUF427 family)
MRNNRTNWKADELLHAIMAARKNVEWKYATPTQKRTLKGLIAEYEAELQRIANRNGEK